MAAGLAGAAGFPLSGTAAPISPQIDNAIGGDSACWEYQSFVDGRWQKNPNVYSGTGVRNALAETTDVTSMQSDYNNITYTTAFNETWKGPGLHIVHFRSRFHRIPCPEPKTNPYAGLDGLGLQLLIIKDSARAHTTERFIDTGEITNVFNDSVDPVGFGISLFYKFPWINSIALAPFAEFDYLHASVNHTFPGGSFLGTTANVAGTFGLKVGPQINPSLWVYGIAGVSVLNETLNVNFIPVSSSHDETVAGATVGGGIAWQPSFLQGFGRPVALNFEYTHTWWQDAHFDSPASSPFFNYTFGRRDDLFKFGFTVALSPSAPAAEPPIPVKARPSK